MNTPFGIGMGFQIMNLIMTLIFVLFFVLVAAALFRNLAQWRKDEKAPRLTVDAQVVARRTEIRRHNHGTGVDGYTTRSASYYVTFQFESGDRLELKVQGHEYGLMVEGDRGKLTFQGNRFLGFERV